MIGPVPWLTAMLEAAGTVQRDWGLWFNSLREGLNPVIGPQQEKTFWAGPTTGAAAPPDWRPIYESDLVYGTKHINYVFAGPPSGASLEPTWRALVEADLVFGAKAANLGFFGPAAGSAAVPGWRSMGQADLAAAEVAQDYALTGDTNNVVINATTTVLRVTQPDYNGGVPYYITGLTGGAAGRVLWVYNLPTSGGYVGLAQDNAGSTAANRVYAWKGASSTLLGGVWTRLWYDAAASRWTQTTGVT